MLQLLMIGQEWKPNEWVVEYDGVDDVDEIENLRCSSQKSGGSSTVDILDQRAEDIVCEMLETNLSCWNPQARCNQQGQYTTITSIWYHPTKKQKSRRFERVRSCPGANVVCYMTRPFM